MIYNSYNKKLSSLLRNNFFGRRRYIREILFPKKRVFFSRRNVPRFGRYSKPYHQNSVLFPRKLYGFRSKLKRYKPPHTRTSIGPKRVKFFKNFFRTKKKGIKNINKSSNWLNTQIYAQSFGMVKPKWLERQRLLFARRRGLKRRRRRRRRRANVHRIKNRHFRIILFPLLSITKKPLHTRMGKGKGKPQGFIVPIAPYKKAFEINAKTSYTWIRSFIQRLNTRAPIFFKAKYKKTRVYKKIFQGIFPTIATVTNNI